jgi:hypothetical protein
MRGGEIGGRFAVVAGSAWIGSGGQKKFEHDVVSKLCGRVKRGVSHLLPGVNVRSVFDEQLHDRGVANGGRSVDRCDAKHVARGGVDVSAALDQRPRQVGLSEKDGQANRRESIVRVGIEQRRIRVQHLRRELDASECTRLAERQRGAAIEEELRQLRMSVVDREEDRRDAVLACAEERGIGVEKARHCSRIVFADGVEELFLLHGVKS